MAPQIDPYILELLCSHICHDLISPVSAVNNGAELIEECGPDILSEALSLIMSSGQQAAKRLNLFRLAYGAGASQAKIESVRSAIEDYYAGSKISLSWRLEGWPSYEGTARLLSLFSMLGQEILPYGGQCNLLVKSEEILMEFKGDRANLKPEAYNAFTQETPILDITPRTVHAYLTGWYTRYYKWSFLIDQAENIVRLHLSYT